MVREDGISHPAFINRADRHEPNGHPPIPVGVDTDGYGVGSRVQIPPRPSTRLTAMVNSDVGRGGTVTLTPGVNGVLPDKLWLKRLTGYIARTDGLTRQTATRRKNTLVTAFGLRR